MAYRHQIAITSESGVGSTSATRELKKLLDGGRWKFVSGGEIFRAMAKNANMTVEEFSAFAKQYPAAGYDKRVDEEIKSLAEKRNYLVGEGRMVHIFMKDAFKVLLTCPINVRAERRQKDFPELNVQEMRKRIEDRDRHDNCRYAIQYPFCHWFPEDFDLHLDTSQHSAEEGASRILASFNTWIEVRQNTPALTA